MIVDRPVVAGSIDILAGLFEQSQDADAEHGRYKCLISCALSLTCFRDIDDLFSDVD